jgi:branched-chain amino acid transport system permease protein
VLVRTLRGAKSYESAIGLSLILIVLVATFHFVAAERFDLTVSEMLVRMVVVVGMFIFIGNSGVISFGHVGFMCIGAYAAGWASCDPDFKNVMLRGLPEFLRNHQYPYLPVIFGAGLLSSIVALGLGVVIIRLSGVAAAIATFAFLVVVNSVYSNWDSVTGATSTMVGIPTVVNPLVLVMFAILVIAVTAVFQKSRVGLMLRASRDDAVAAKAAGIDIVKVRLLAFTLSAFVVGMGGALYAHLLGVLIVDAFFLPLTFMTLAMLVVGGIGSLTGAVIGVVAVTLVTEALRSMEGGISIGPFLLNLPHGAQEIGLGVFMCVILVLRPTGLTRSGELQVSWFRSKPRQRLPSPAVDSTASTAPRTSS